MDPIAALAMIKKVWDAWDVRVMILLSLSFQIILFTLGNRRKHTVKSWLEILIWLAYLSADWVTTAALGKLSTTCQEESAPTDILRGLWASLLLLHLGGPDTLTAIALEDNLLWTRHLFWLVFQSALAIYVIVLSWTRSQLSLLTFLLFSAGIIKYSERIWCLYSATRKDWNRRPPLFDTKILESVVAGQNPESVTEAEKIVLAHQWFAIKRPYMKNYFSTAGNLRSLGAKLAAHWRDIITDYRSENDFRSLADKSPLRCMFDIVAIELGFMFDMLYTKTAIVYTKLGWILRLISFFCSSFVLLSFLNSFSSGSPQEQYSSRVDIYITEILLAGAVALEFYGLFVIISSDWFELLRIRYRKSCLLSGIFQVMHWSLLKPLRKRKRWSGSMGQFNLLRYCISFRKRKGIKILQMVGIDEMLQKHCNTSFRDIPSSLKEPESFPPVPPGQLFEIRNHPSVFTKGERALQRYRCIDEIVIDTVRMDLDETIMIWHIAMDILYPHPLSATTDERIRTCKVISDYMMYLSATKPSMVAQGENFWFDSFSRELRKNLQQNNISPDDETRVYFNFLCKVLPEEFNGTPSKDVITHAFRVVEVLSRRPDIWNIMRSVWLEIMHYAAIYCPHASHLQELRRGGEFLTLHWLLDTYNYHALAAMDMNWAHEMRRREAEVAQFQALQATRNALAWLPWVRI